MNPVLAENFATDRGGSAVRRVARPLTAVRTRRPRRPRRWAFAEALVRKGVAVIAELKSPKPLGGMLRPDYDASGAGHAGPGRRALSIWTEPIFSAAAGPFDSRARA